MKVLATVDTCSIKSSELWAILMKTTFEIHKAGLVQAGETIFLQEHVHKWGQKRYGLIRGAAK